MSERGTTSTPARRDPRLGPALRRLTIAVVLSLLGIGAAVVLFARSDSGSAWLLARVPGLVVVAPQGRLVGGPFAAERVEWRGGTRPVVVHGLAWRDTEWQWRPHEGAWLGVVIVDARATRVEVGASTSTAPTTEPATLRLPLALSLAPATLAVLQVDGLGEARDLVARVELGHDQGREHRVRSLALRTDRASLEGEWRIATEPPFALAAQVRARSGDGADRRWQAEASLAGPLAAPVLDARLTSPEAGGAAFEARAGLAPFAPWPIASLEARMRDLDLAALRKDAPQTRLSGQARIETHGLDRPMTARIELANALAGRWDQGRAPVAAVDLELVGQADRPSRLEFKRFDIRLAANAGRIGGSGEWNDGNAQLDLALTAVRPALLDARAPAMTVSGTLAVQAAGLPAPDGSRPAAQALQARSRLALEGRLDAQRGAPVSLKGELLAERSRERSTIEWREFDARAAGARLHGQALLARAADGAWQITSQGEASDFDPTPWWPAAPAARLNGRWQADIAAPGAWAPPKSGLAGWLVPRGAIQIDLRDSQLAGVALAGQARLDGRGAGWAVDAQVRAAGNAVALQGRFAPRADDDGWRATVDAPALAALRPWGALSRGSAAWFDTLDGSLGGELQASGRWPVLATTGSLRASGLHAGTLGAQRLQAQWRAGPDRDAPFALTLEGERLAQGAQTLDALKAQFEGSLATHRITLEASSTLRPPAWTDPIVGLRATPRGSRLLLRGDGRWQGVAQAPSPLAGTWRARLAEIDVRSPQAPQPWLAARDVDLYLALDGDGRLAEVAAEPGRAQVLGAPLLWREARWRPEAPGRRAQVALDAELAPTNIVPWLQRWQPDAGFGGNLAFKGRFVVRRAESFAADIVLERAGGDLTITDEGDTQSLGLTDLRLALAAADGTWHFTQAAAGSDLGVLAGAQSLRVAPEATWPAPDTPMQGVLEWRVPDIGVWARFTPPGWRVAGALRTSAAFGGRFGAPEVEGRMEGSGLAVRNLLQGVDLRDGELALSLRGADARVERFTFKGGDGVLRLTGGASLGAEPSAKLHLVAERFRLLGRIDRRIVVSGETDLTLAARSVALDGKLAIDEGLIDVSRGDAPALDADVLVRGGRARRPVAEPMAEAVPPNGAPQPRGGPALVNVRVALQLELGQQLKLRGRGLDTRLAGGLTITAPGGKLALNGQVRTLEGTYAAYGQKLEIERGMLLFTGEAGNPRLDILAVRPNLDVKVGVLVGGTALSPRVRLTSEPEMSDYDKLSWLVLGRAPDGLARADTALLQRAALALLAGEGQTPDAALLANLGLDEVSVHQVESGEVRETVVTLGKQLSRRWYVGYERGVTSTTGTWQLIYRVAQRFTLRAQSGADNSLDAIWTWRWN